ncbi:MAG: response regulator transcription factor [Acidobacteria bacterium]|nr:response regulator transcription factor [Acidobacteriota bacterium]
MIRVLLADDQMLMRQGLRGLLDLTDDLRVVAEAGDGEATLLAVKEHTPDVLLLDVRMPKGSGLDVLAALGREKALPPTILLTTFDDDEALMTGLRTGARGFLLKDVSFETLTDAVRRVARGESLLLPAVTERVKRRLDGETPAFESWNQPDRLSPRETEVLRLMAGGLSNREIAEALGTSERTVKNQASAVLAKLGVRDRTRAVLRALDLGLI